MTVVSPTAANISASEERGALVQWYTAGADINLGEAVYLDASNEALPAIATSSAAAQAVGLAAFAPNFYGETAINEGDQVGVVVYGPVWGFTGLVSGQPLFVDKTTAGDMNDTAPTAAYQYIVGHAVADDTFFVDPGTTTPQSA